MLIRRLMEGKVKVPVELRDIKSCDRKKPYIFISYSSSDRELVLEDVREFQRRGYNVWLDDRNIDKTKSSWRQDALEAISDLYCGLLVFYVSRNSLTSEACYSELQQTVDEQTQAIHFGPVKFIAIDAEEIGDIMEFSRGVHHALTKSALSKEQKQQKAIVLSKFIKNFFGSNNEKVRVHPKNEQNRKMDYYEEILASFPEDTRTDEISVPVHVCHETAKSQADDLRSWTGDLQSQLNHGQGRYDNTQPQGDEARDQNRSTDAEARDPEKEKREAAREKQIKIEEDRLRHFQEYFPDENRVSTINPRGDSYKLSQYKQVRDANNQVFFLEELKGVLSELEKIASERNDFLEKWGKNPHDRDENEKNIATCDREIEELKRKIGNSNGEGGKGTGLVRSLLESNLSWDYIQKLKIDAQESFTKKRSRVEDVLTDVKRERERVYRELAETVAATLREKGVVDQNSSRYPAAEKRVLIEKADILTDINGQHTEEELEQAREEILAYVEYVQTDISRTQDRIYAIKMGWDDLI